MFFNKIHYKINTVILGVIFLFFLVLLKVFYIQVIDYGKLSNLADSLWNRNLPIESNRGIITDRNGVVLAGKLKTKKK